MRRIFWFALGFILAALLSRTTAVTEAQQSVLLMGVASGVPKVITVDASSNLNIHVQ
jgi:hypothetical protein